MSQDTHDGHVHGDQRFGRRPTASDGSSDEPPAGESHTLGRLLWGLSRDLARCMTVWVLSGELPCMLMTLSFFTWIFSFLVPVADFAPCILGSRDAQDTVLWKVPGRWAAQGV